MDRNDYSVNDIYCYPNSTTLKNLFNITDADHLDKIEQTVVATRLTELNDIFLPYPISFLYLKEIHKYLFQSIYIWAGKIRTVRLSKPNLAFAYPEYILQETNKLFKKLKTKNYYKQTTKSDFCCYLADFKTEINIIHPFRDGNGRSIRKLLEDIAFKAGFRVHFEKISYAQYLQAMIESSNDNTLLKNLLMDIITFL